MSKDGVTDFKLVSPFKPSGDQPTAITQLVDGLEAGLAHQTLLGATGTGKTFIAFQIAWKLFNARWNNRNAENQRPRILFLADRNILADQAYNSFNY